MGTAGATLEAADLLALRDLPRVLGLAEFMNVPGAVLGLPGALEKILAFRDGHIDGHAPGVTGPWLQAYVAAGPSTDHESMTAEEALEKARLGMHVLVREATAARNLHALIPAITPENARRFAFATDDRHPADLIDEGSVDHNLRLAIAAGLPPITALRMATLNAAETFGLTDRGAIGPGRRADLVVTPSLDRLPRGPGLRRGQARRGRRRARGRVAASHGGRKSRAGQHPRGRRRALVPHPGGGNARPRHRRHPRPDRDGRTGDGGRHRQRRSGLRRRA